MVEVPPEATIAAVATLAEQAIGVQRQLSRMESVSAEQVHAAIALLRESEARITALTDAKFVTYRTLIDSQAEKVALALAAAEKAIDKQEIATQKAIDKESEANADRFAKVNEFRGQQADMIARFATAERVDLLFSQVSRRLEEVNTNLQERLNELNTRIGAAEQYAKGAQANMTKIYAALGVATGLIVMIVVVMNFVIGR